VLSMIDLPAHPHWVAVRAEVDARIEQLAEQRRLALMCWTSLRKPLEWPRHGHDDLDLCPKR